MRHHFVRITASKRSCVNKTHRTKLMRKSFEIIFFLEFTPSHRVPKTAKLYVFWLVFRFYSTFINSMGCVRLHSARMYGWEDDFVVRITSCIRQRNLIKDSVFRWAEEKTGGGGGMSEKPRIDCQCGAFAVTQNPHWIGNVAVCAQDEHCSICRRLFLHAVSCLISVTSRHRDDAYNL